MTDMSMNGVSMADMGASSRCEARCTLRPEDSPMAHEQVSDTLERGSPL